MHDQGGKSVQNEYLSGVWERIFYLIDLTRKIIDKLHTNILVLIELRMENMKLWIYSESRNKIDFKKDF